MIKPLLSRSLRLLLFLGQAALIVFVTLVLAGAFAARQRADLQIWHTVELESEFRVGSPVDTLDEYLQLEDRLFAELGEKVSEKLPSSQPDELNRYARNSRANPDRGGRNWNRTQIYQPDDLRGGVLMLHGMTDSPYSMRHLANLYGGRGYYVLNLRVPGHGTVPSELDRIDWRDWQAAVRLGAREVQKKLEPDQPFYVVGYSSGGSLALQYTLDSLGEEELRVPDRIVLLSPMVGVSGLARFGRIYFWLGRLEYFRKARWLDILPEYDPHKYNSFPMNGPRQSLALTSEVSNRLMGLKKSGALSAMPPVLTFQSLVDATVVTRDIVTRLYDQLPENGSELILFDVNRRGVLEFFVEAQHDALIERLMQAHDPAYIATLISNETSRTDRVVALRRRPHTADPETVYLDLTWPENVYSLSHVALPFPPHDPVYGYEASPDPKGFPRLGMAQAYGESGAISPPPSLFTRLRSNPFHEYVEERINGLID